MTPTHGQRPLSSPASQRGLTLIEMMIALVLGILVIGSVVAVFLANRQSYNTNRGLAQIQDEARTAFTLMARDIRQAGLTGCGNVGRVANVLNDQSTAWYANWNNAIMGYDNASKVEDPALAGSNAISGTGASSIELLGASSYGFSVYKHDPKSATIKLNEPTSDLQTGEIILVCDPDHAAITQITNYNSSNVTVVHNTGTASPGNCSKGLGYPTDCSSTLGNQYAFPRNSQIAKLSATDWYIGTNPVGTTSLYRISVVTSAGVPTPTPEEMVRNVREMTIQYHVQNATNFVTATNVTANSNWASVDAVRITLKLESSNQFPAAVSSTGAPEALDRYMTTTIALRNRIN